jgi:cell shape-determining protein MreC
MASEMKQFETFDDFIDATEVLLGKDGEGWNACYVRMEKLVETEKENSELKEENDNWEADDNNLTKVMSMVSKELEEDDISWTSVDDIIDIVKQLKNENRQLKIAGDKTAEALNGRIEFLKEENKKLKEELRIADYYQVGVLERIAPILPEDAGTLHSWDHDAIGVIAEYIDELHNTG